MPRLFRFLPLLFLTACAGGGSFDLDDVAIKSDSSRTPAKPEIRYRDEHTPTDNTGQPPSQIQTAYGFAAKLKHRNLYPKNVQQHSALSAGDWIKLDKGEPDVFQQKDEIFQKGDAHDSWTASDGLSRSTGYTDFRYVRSGHIYSNARIPIDRENKIYLSGADGYLFYRGKEPSTALPVGKTLYKGTWDYMTDAEAGQSFAQLGSLAGGNKSSAFSATEDGLLLNSNEAVAGQQDFGLTGEFEVDFANKSMTGALYRNNRITQANPNDPKQTKRYDIQAVLYGNRFQGKAAAVEKGAGKEHPFTSDAHDLEGGFYGPQGDELAGKFLADDKKVLAVFSGKQKDASSKPAAQVIIDAYTIGSDSAPKLLDTFGDLHTLLLNGETLTLLPPSDNPFSFQNMAEQGKTKITVCCSNLHDIRFGLFQQNGGQGMFLQGNRTALADMPVSKEDALYRGTWFGQIDNGIGWSAQASDKDDGNRAEFKVNFSDKTMSGKLTAQDRIQPVFTIHAQIQGNGFTGTAQTGERGFALDPKNQINPRYTHIQTTVNGGFYGKTAGELGGSFSSGPHEGGKVQASVVFAAKRQQAVQ